MKRSDSDVRFIRWNDVNKETPELSIKKKFVDLSLTRYSTIHWHDHFEFEILTEGSAIHTINETTYRLKPGDMYLIAPSVLHMLRPDPESDNKNIVIYTMQFNNVTVSESSFSEFMEISSTVTATADPESLAKLIHLADDMVSEAKEPQVYTERRFSHLLFSTILLFMRLYRQQHENEIFPSSPGPQGELSNIRSAIAYIKYNFRNSTLSVPEIANKVYLSPNYFGMLFKKHIGMPCLTYIKKLRLEFAAGLLLQTPLTVNEIAEKSGYINNSYFISDFRNFYQVPPQQFRNMNQKNPRPGIS